MHFHCKSFFERVIYQQTTEKLLSSYFLSSYEYFGKKVLHSNALTFEFLSCFLFRLALQKETCLSFFISEREYSFRAGKNKCINFIDEHPNIIIFIYRA
jgi:hypothetical protein